MDYTDTGQVLGSAINTVHDTESHQQQIHQQLQNHILQQHQQNQQQLHHQSMNLHNSSAPLHQASAIPQSQLEQQQQSTDHPPSSPQQQLQLVNTSPASQLHLSLHQLGLPSSHSTVNFTSPAQPSPQQQPIPPGQQVSTQAKDRMNCFVVTVWSLLTITSFILARATYENNSRLVLPFIIVMGIMLVTFTTKFVIGVVHELIKGVVVPIFLTLAFAVPIYVLDFYIFIVVLSYYKWLTVQEAYATPQDVTPSTSNTE